MKLRIKGNSIRLRLGQSEVRRLAIEGTVEDLTVFGPGTQQRFGYALCASSDQADVSATFSDRRIVVRVPADDVRQWLRTDQVGIHAVQRTEEGDLSILIEKDFECIDAPPDESQEDAFPNPQ